MQMEGKLGKGGKERREGGVEKEERVRGEILFKGGGKQCIIPWGEGEEDIKRDMRSLDLIQAPRGESQAI